MSHVRHMMGLTPATCCSLQGGIGGSAFTPQQMSVSIPMFKTLLEILHEELWADTVSTGHRNLFSVTIAVLEISHTGCNE